MTSLESVLGHRAGRPLRQLVYRALFEVYTFNADRLDSDDGDGNYGLAGLLRDNIPHRLATAVVGFERRHGVAATVPSGRNMRLLVDGHTICFYKAPPGANGLGDIAFDDSDFKQYLVHRNAAHGQRTIDFRDGDEAGIDTADDERDILVVVHFGNSDTGLERAIVGVPYEVSGTIAWDWNEDLYDDGEDYTSASDIDAPPAPAGDPFGLRLREDERTGDQ